MILFIMDFFNKLHMQYGTKYMKNMSLKLFNKLHMQYGTLI